MATNNKLQQIIFSSGDEYYKNLLNDINHAEKTIDLETYIFNHDDLGIKIIDALIAAKERGVEVRVLVDGAGSPLWGGRLTKKLEKAGVQTRIFHPFPWRLWHWSRSHVKKPFLLKAIYLFLKINSRNHRKVCIIDDKIAYVGSFNISKVHLEKSSGGDDWRDTAVKLSGINLKAISDAFRASWLHLTIHDVSRKKFNSHSNPILRLNNTRQRRRYLYKNLLDRIKRCKNRIWMTNAYFVPDNFLLKDLIDAAHRGIDVRIMLPRKSDIFFMPWASSAFYRSLLKNGVRIFEYLPSMLHTKNLIVDDWVIVGSSNLNHRSLLHDLEIDVNICVPEAKKQIEQEFLADLKKSQEINLEHWYKRPLYQRLLGKLLLYVKFWI